MPYPSFLLRCLQFRIRFLATFTESHLGRLLLTEFQSSAFA